MKTSYPIIKSNLLSSSIIHIIFTLLFFLAFSFSSYARAYREVYTFEFTHDDLLIEEGEEVFVIGNHPDLGDGDLVKARKLSLDDGVWHADIAIGYHEGLSYRYLSRDLTVNEEFCDDGNVLFLTDELILEPLEQAFAEDFEGKSVYYITDWDDVILRYKQADEWVDVTMQKLGQVPGYTEGMNLFFAQGMGYYQQDLEFYFYNSEAEEDRSEYSIYETALNTFVVKGREEVTRQGIIRIGEVYNYMPEQEQSGLSGSTFPVETDMEFTVAERSVKVRLPRGYTQNSDKYYPVIYQQDFATSLDALNEGSERGRTREVIIVAVADNNRMAEYMPLTSDVLDPNSFVYGVDALGDQYAEFLINDVMPEVESRYRILSGRENTFNNGYSMGGLISTWIHLEHNDVFGGAGSGSPSYWRIPQYIEEISEKDKKDLKLYFDTGTVQDQWTGIWNMYDELVQSGYVVNQDFSSAVGCGHTHRNDFYHTERMQGASEFFLNIFDEENELESGITYSDSYFGEVVFNATFPNWLKVGNLDYLYNVHFPFSYSSNHGWLYFYAEATTFESGAWFYDYTLNEWFWTASSTFPWLYRAEDSTWYYYLRAELENRVFYNSQSGLEQTL